MNQENQNFGMRDQMENDMKEDNIDHSPREISPEQQPSPLRTEYPLPPQQAALLGLPTYSNTGYNIQPPFDPLLMTPASLLGAQEFHQLRTGDNSQQEMNFYAGITSSSNNINNNNINDSRLSHHGYHNQFTNMDSHIDKFVDVNQVAGRGLGLMAEMTGSNNAAAPLSGMAGMGLQLGMDLNQSMPNYYLQPAAVTHIGYSGEMNPSLQQQQQLQQQHMQFRHQHLPHHSQQQHSVQGMLPHMQHGVPRNVPMMMQSQMGMHEQHMLQQQQQQHYGTRGIPHHHQQQQQQFTERPNYISIGSSSSERTVSSSRSRSHSMNSTATGGSNAQGRAINKMLLDILRERVIDAQRLDLAVDNYAERMDCVNLATLLFHTGKKRLLLIPTYIKRIAMRFQSVTDELRAREASNALYGLKCMSSDVPEVRELVLALANKLASSASDFVAQAVGNALYGLQLMSSEYDEVRFLLHVLAVKVSRCSELLEAQNIGNALYGIRGMNSDHKEVREVLAALTPKIATAREDLNGQALGNSLYGLQSMSSKEAEVRYLLAVLAGKVTRTWEDLKAQEVGNALYGLKRMSTDAAEVRALVSALVAKVASSLEILDAQAIGNSLYGLQNMRSDSTEVLSLLAVLAEKIAESCAELDGQAMGNSLYGLQGMNSDYPEVRAVVSALTVKIQSSCLEMNAQELGNALFGLQNMSSEHADVRKLIATLTVKASSSKHELTSQEIGNALFGLQGMSSNIYECRLLIRQLVTKIQQSHAALDPLGVSNSLFGMQRLSSECEDVRLLVQVLAVKIEQSWKQLSAQHVAHSLYGLQCLSSNEVEVKNLIRAFTPKVSSCHDLMIAPQLSIALFGMRNFSSDDAETLPLLSAIREKLEQSQDTWTMSTLAAALFGLQGMSSQHEEVAAIVGALAQKALLMHVADPRKLDPIDFGNCFFGLQRMNSWVPEVGKLLAALADKFAMISSVRNHVSAKVCANMIFGLHNSSAADYAVQLLLSSLTDHIRQVNNSFSSSTPQQQHADQFFSHDNRSVDSSTMSHQSHSPTSAVNRIDDALALYQAMALALFAMRDLEAFPELNERLYAELAALRNLIDANKSELSMRQLSTVERKMANELTDLLSEEPYAVSSGVLLYGFEMQTYVKLRPGVHLKTSDGSQWCPSLNIEACGTSFSLPSKQLFYSLRKQYLEREFNVHVDYVPVESFSAADGAAAGFNSHLGILSALYPPTAQDATAFASTLSAAGFPLSGNVGLMGTVKVGSSGSGSSIGSVGAMVRNSLSSIDSNQEVLSPRRRSSNPPVEYFDDDFKRNVVSSFNDNKKFKNHASSRACKPPMGMHMGWLGLLPLVSRHAATAGVSTNVATTAAGTNVTSTTATMNMISPRTSGGGSSTPRQLTELSSAPHHRRSPSSPIVGSHVERSPVQTSGVSSHNSSFNSLMAVGAGAAASISSRETARSSTAAYEQGLARFAIENAAATLPLSHSTTQQQQQQHVSAASTAATGYATRNVALDDYNSSSSSISPHYYSSNRREMINKQKLSMLSASATMSCDESATMASTPSGLTTQGPSSTLDSFSSGAVSGSINNNNSSSSSRVGTSQRMKLDLSTLGLSNATLHPAPRQVEPSAESSVSKSSSNAASSRSSQRVLSIAVDLPPTPLARTSRSRSEAQLMERGMISSASGGPSSRSMDAAEMTKYASTKSIGEVATAVAADITAEVATPTTATATKSATVPGTTAATATEGTPPPTTTTVAVVAAGIAETDDSDADKDELDDEIAALEAQLEVARIEARLKALKAQRSKAAQKHPPSPMQAAIPRAAATAEVEETAANVSSVAEHAQKISTADEFPTVLLAPPPTTTATVGAEAVDVVCSHDQEMDPSVFMVMERGSSSFSSLADFPTEEPPSNKASHSFRRSGSNGSNGGGGDRSSSNGSNGGGSGTYARSTDSGSSAATNFISAPSLDVYDVLNASSLEDT